MNYWDDMEKRVRGRGVRVEERLRLINELKSSASALENVGRKREEILEAVRSIAKRLRDELQ